METRGRSPEPSSFPVPTAPVRGARAVLRAASVEGLGLSLPRGSPGLEMGLSRAGRFLSSSNTQSYTVLCGAVPKAW